MSSPRRRNSQAVGPGGRATTPGAVQGAAGRTAERTEEAHGEIQTMTEKPRKTLGKWWINMAKP